jgi:hypothetical protein
MCARDVVVDLGHALSFLFDNLMLASLLQNDNRPILLSNGLVLLRNL